jgi:hypothetical protein
MELRLVILDGSPFAGPLLWTAPRTPGGERSVRVPCEGGVDHFERTPEFAEVAGCRIPVYRWLHHTPDAAPARV